VQNAATVPVNVSRSMRHNASGYGPVPWPSLGGLCAPLMKGAYFRRQRAQKAAPLLVFQLRDTPFR
jgi:hypothetical protein